MSRSSPFWTRTNFPFWPSRWRCAISHARQTHLQASGESFRARLHRAFSGCRSRQLRRPGRPGSPLRRTQTRRLLRLCLHAGRCHAPDHRRRHGTHHLRRGRPPGPFRAVSNASRIAGLDLLTVVAQAKSTSTQGLVRQRSAAQPQRDHRRAAKPLVSASPTRVASFGGSWKFIISCCGHRADGLHR